MSNVWVAVSDEIEDSFAEEENHVYRVLGVFSTQEKAREFAPSSDIQCFEVDGIRGELIVSPDGTAYSRSPRTSFGGWIDNLEIPDHE